MPGMTPHSLKLTADVRLGKVDISNDEYHAGPGASKSHLDVIDVSPAHYWQAYRNPNREPRESTPAFITGQVIHSAVLEPDLLQSEYVVVPAHAPTRPTIRQINAARPSPETVQAIAWWDWFNASNKGKTVLDQSDWDIAMGVRDSVFKHPAARKLLSHGKAEQAYYAIDPETGLLVKCKTDWDALEHGFILDVKSTLSAAPKDFARSVMDYRYHVQQPFYQGVIEAALDAPISKRWYFLAVEKKPPFAVAVYTLPEGIVAGGRVAAADNLMTLADCDRTDTWPAYSDDVTELDFPRWARAQAGADSPETDFA